MSKDEVLKIQVSSSSLCFLSTQDILPLRSVFVLGLAALRFLEPACLLPCLIPCMLFVCLSSSPNPQTCLFKVNIHCDGCRKKVKKILSKIDGKRFLFNCMGDLSGCFLFRVVRGKCVEFIDLVCRCVPEQHRPGGGEGDGVRPGGSGRHH